MKVGFSIDLLTVPLPLQAGTGQAILCVKEDYFIKLHWVAGVGLRGYSEEASALVDILFLVGIEHYLMTCTCMYEKI
jgi:hypothetical protein